MSSCACLSRADDARICALTLVEPPPGTRRHLGRLADGGLKRFIKDRQAKHQWDDADEADFIKGMLSHDSFSRTPVAHELTLSSLLPALESELEKVAKFQESKVRVDCMRTHKAKRAIEDRGCPRSGRLRPSAVDADTVTLRARLPS